MACGIEEIRIDSGVVSKVLLMIDIFLHNPALALIRFDSMFLFPSRLCRPLAIFPDHRKPSEQRLDA